MRLAIAALLVTSAGLAHAETRRVAVIVGNNAGNDTDDSLRYAEDDAAKVARVLTELGGVAMPDLFLVQGGNLARLDRSLREAKARIAANRAAGRDRVVVIFYYSGHSDGVALELGRDRYAFSSLRRWLAQTNADVRLGFVDACKSGALLAAKGGTPGPAFQIRLTDDLASTGEALLTSSAATEDALESQEIGGSFFTHHLVSGLRGAADASGDRQVTLGEAYRYAYAHTITMNGARVGVAESSPSGLHGGIEVATGRDGPIRETFALASGGYQRGFARGPLVPRTPTAISCAMATSPS